MEAKYLLILLTASSCRGLFTLLYPKKYLPSWWLVWVWSIAITASTAYFAKELFVVPVIAVIIGISLVLSFCFRRHYTVFRFDEDYLDDKITKSIEKAGVKAERRGETWYIEKRDWSITHKYNIGESQVSWYGDQNDATFIMWKKIFEESLAIRENTVLPLKSLYYLVGPFVIMIIMKFRGWF